MYENKREREKRYFYPLWSTAIMSKEFYWRPAKVEIGHNLFDCPLVWRATGSREVTSFLIWTAQPITDQECPVFSMRGTKWVEVKTLQKGPYTPSDLWHKISKTFIKLPPNFGGEGNIKEYSWNIMGIITEALRSIM